MFKKWSLDKYLNESFENDTEINYRWLIEQFMIEGVEFTNAYKSLLDKFHTYTKDEMDKEFEKTKADIIAMLKYRNRDTDPQGIINYIRHVFITYAALQNKEKSSSIDHKGDLDYCTWSKKYAVLIDQAYKKVEEFIDLVYKNDPISLALKNANNAWMYRKIHGPDPHGMSTKEMSKRYC